MSRGGRLLIQENYSSSATMSTDFEHTPLELALRTRGLLNVETRNWAAVQRVQLQEERAQGARVRMQSMAP